MDWLNVVIVEPMYQQNLGYIARVSKNFGIKKLNLVRPRCNYRGREAIKYSKHAKDLLLKAATFKSIREATKSTFVVGTTALWRKTGKAFYNVYEPSQLLRLIKRNRIKEVSILIGRDDTGLTKEELMECDANVFIPTNEEYPALNISHALAIMLYAFSASERWKDRPEAPDCKEMERINLLIDIFVSKRKGIRDKKAVAMALRHMMMRSSPTKEELRAISVAFSPKEDR